MLKAPSTNWTSSEDFAPEWRLRGTVQGSETPLEKLEQFGGTDRNVEKGVGQGVELSKVLKPPQTDWTSLEEQTGEWRLRGPGGGTVQGNESLVRLSFQHCLPSH